MKYVFALNSNNDIEQILNKDIPINNITSCIGMYKGQYENSYMIEDLNGELWDKVHALTAQNGQESYLTIDNENRTDIWFLKGDSPEFLGFWTNVSESYALNKDCFTKIGNTYYVSKFK